MPKLNKKDLLLYLVTDRSWLSGRTLTDAVKDAIVGGVTMVQLREKHLSDDEFIKLALEIKQVCSLYHIPLIINDNLNVMLKVDADGIHIGQDDLDPYIVRKQIGDNKILGLSVQTLDQAYKAKEANVDYIGIGAMYPTSTKKDAKYVSISTLKDIVNQVNIPSVVIGGININNIKEFNHININGFALISAILNNADIVSATKQRKQEIRKAIKDE